MMRPQTRLLLAPLVLTVTLLLGCGDGDAEAGDASEAAQPAGSAAPASSARNQGDADLVEISEYELTMEDVRAWAEVHNNLARAAQENPQLEAALESDDDDAGEMSLDQIERSIERIPEAREALDEAGITAREYAVVFFAMFQAGMAKYLVEQGRPVDEVARELEINPANIRFVQEHEAELAALRAESAGASGEDEDQDGEER